MTLDLRRSGATGYQLVEYLPGLREKVHLASPSVGAVVEAAQALINSRPSLKVSSYLRCFLTDNS